MGEFDADGYLRITDRKKDLIITAGGKNVAPAEMEAHIKTINGVGQAVVVGDRQPYLCALLALDPEQGDAPRIRRYQARGQALLDEIGWLQAFAAHGCYASRRALHHRNSTAHHAP